MLLAFRWSQRYLDIPNPSDKALHVREQDCHRAEEVNATDDYNILKKWKTELLLKDCYCTNSSHSNKLKTNEKK